MKKILIILIIGLILISGCNYIKYGLPNCKHDDDCKIDETCAVHGDEFEISVNKCEKLNCDPLMDGTPTFLLICREGQPPSWKHDGIGKQYVGEIHTCSAERHIDYSICRKIRTEEI